ncbi:MAG: hypothetical protein IJF92_04720 [Bacilli bacterium]|nr:hypothetical protein [Bacilli bacterium]
MDDNKNIVESNQEDFDFELADETLDFDEQAEETFEIDENDDINIRYTDNSRMAYRDALKKREMDLEKKIEKLDNKIKQAKIFTKHAEIKRLTLKKELESIIREKIEYANKHENKYRDKKIIHGLDKFHDHQSSKEKEFVKQIKHLENMKKKLTESGETKRIDKKIEKKQEKLQKLINREVRVTRMQRSIIMSRRALQRRKHKLLKQAAKVDYYENKENYMKDLRNKLDYSETITGNIKNSIVGKVYEHKENRYRKKKEKREAVLKEMKNKKIIGIVGANVIVTAKRIAKKISGESELDAMFNSENLDNNQSINRSK